MVSLDASCRAVGEITLVECRLRNDDSTPKRVRVESRLDGGLWPPRDAGAPARGWDDDGVTLRLPADSTVGVGFAAAAPAAQPPAVVVDVEPADGGDTTTDGEPSVEPTADGVVRSLSDPRPPRDGVPLGADGGYEADGAVESDSADGGRAVGGTTPSPADLGDWFGRVEQRVERLEGVAAAGTLPAATRAVADAGGLDGVRETVERTRSDREQLLALAEQAQTLLGRIEAADPPVETLERLS